MNAEKQDEKWWVTVKEKAGHTASLEVEEKADQQHLLLQLSVSKITSTRRMPPEVGRKQAECQDQLAV